MISTSRETKSRERDVMTDFSVAPRLAYERRCWWRMVCWISNHHVLKFWCLENNTVTKRTCSFIHYVNVKSKYNKICCFLLQCWYRLHWLNLLNFRWEAKNRSRSKEDIVPNSGWTFIDFSRTIYWSTALDKTIEYLFGVNWLSIAMN